MTELPTAESARADGVEWQRKLGGLIAAKGSKLSPAEFQKAINVVFHDVEAEVYDEIHSEMWESLVPLVQQLSSDALSVRPGATSLDLTDVGCGTGLATTLFLRGPLGSRVARIQLADTSTEMLERCKLSARHWGKPAHFTHGGIELLPSASADVLLTSSVLHHIPDTAPFCAEIARVLRPGGVYIHMQDPLAGRDTDSVLQQRVQALAAVQQDTRPMWLSWPRLFRLPFSAWVRFKQWRQDGYLREVNRRLLRAGVIKTAMTGSELWSVTDIHVDGLPYAAGGGISRELLERSLLDFENVSFRSYGYFGRLASHLPKHFANEETRLSRENDQHGAHVAGVWQRKP